MGVALAAVLRGLRDISQGFVYGCLIDADGDGEAGGFALFASTASEGMCEVSGLPREFDVDGMPGK